MKFAPAVIFASAIMLMPAANTCAGSDAEKRALYSAVNVVNFFTKETTAELKVTLAQQQILKAGRDKRDKIWRKYAEECGKVGRSNLREGEKNARLRALETKASDDLFRAFGEALRPDQVKRMKQIVLQVRGMEVFDYPEVRDALKIGDKEARVLRDAYDKLAREMVADLKAQVSAKRISSEEAARKATSMTLSVPAEVRESLSADQRKVLEDLLGEKYTYGK